MRQAPQPIGAGIENGLTSVCNVLLMISNKTDKTNYILDALLDKTDAVIDVLQNTYQAITSQVENINTLGGASPSRKDDFLNNALIGITEYLKNILDVLNKGITGKSKDKDTKGMGIFDRLKGFADTIKSLKDTLTNKLLKQMDKFNAALDKMNLEKVNLFGAAMTKFGAIMDKLQKVLAPAAMSMLAFAGAFLILSLVAVSPAMIVNLALLTGFIAVLTRVMGSKDAPKNMMQFAGGIGILTLAMFAMSEVPYEGILKMIGFIALLGLTLRLVMSDGIGQKVPPLTSFAFGIAILTLAIFAMNEVPYEGMIKMLAFIAVLGLEIALINKLGGVGMKGLPGFAFGLGLMVLAMFAMNELPFEAMGITLGFVALLGIALKLYNDKAGLTMLMIGGGVAAMSIGFAIFKSSGFTIMDGLALAGTILAISLVTIALGAVASLAIMGAAALIVVGVSTVLVAGSLALISMMTINTDKIIDFVKGAGLLALGMVALTPIAALSLVGAVLMIPVGVSALLLAGSLALISMMTIDEAKVDTFGSAAFTLALTFVKIMPLAALGAVAAALMIVVSVSALATAGVLSLITNAVIDEKKIDTFGVSMTKLVSVYEEFGLISLGKSAIKAGLLLPIVGSAYLAALVFEKIQSLSISETQMENFGGILKRFVDITTDVIGSSVEKLKIAEPGIKALSKLVGVSSQLVDVIQAFANMNYNEYAVKDGKLTLVAVKKIGDKEIEQVGINIGKLIQGLLKPLTIIASDDEMWDFGGGIKVKNPFAGGWFGTDDNSGVNRLKNIGEAFLPLTESISKLSGSTILSDGKALDMFKRGLVSIIDTMAIVLTKIGTWDEDKVEDSIDLIKTFADGFNDIDDKKFKSFGDTMSSFLNGLSDAAKWNSINANLTTLKNNFKEIVSNINMLNIDKALALERNLKLMTDQKSREGLLEVIEKLKEMIGLLMEQQKGVVGNEKTVYQPTPVVGRTQVVDNKKDELQPLIDVLTRNLEAMNNKLGGKLKVVIVDGNANKL